MANEAEILPAKRVYKPGKVSHIGVKVVVWRLRAPTVAVAAQIRRNDDV
jgi:hypothetical protein